MQVTRRSIDTAKGSASWFTGDVYRVSFAAAPTQERIGAAYRLP